MSLVSQLKDGDSVLRCWTDSVFERRRITGFVSEVNTLLCQQPILLSAEHGQYSLVGTAFDYLFRWEFGPLQKIVALFGALLVDKSKQAYTVVETIIQRGNQSVDNITDRAQYAVMLSWFDSVFRSKRIAPELLLALRQSNADSVIHTLKDAIHPDVVADLLLLHGTIHAVWGDELQQPAVLNPTFKGSLHVGGADADWIINGALYDCKVSKKSRPFRGTDALQVLGYVLLDYDDMYRIDQVGWYYARQQVRIQYPLDELLSRFGVQRSIGDLRDDLRSRFRS